MRDVVLHSMHLVTAAAIWLAGAVAPPAETRQAFVFYSSTHCPACEDVTAAAEQLAVDGYRVTPLDLDQPDRLVPLGDTRISVAALAQALRVREVPNVAIVAETSIGQRIAIKLITQTTTVFVQTSTKKLRDYLTTHGLAPTQPARR
ncbi:MAG: hypothetical protein AB7E98_12020 [Pirellulales bacterium]